MVKFVLFQTQIWQSKHITRLMGVSNIGRELYRCLDWMNLIRGHIQMNFREYILKKYQPIVELYVCDAIIKKRERLYGFTSGGFIG